MQQVKLSQDEILTLIRNFKNEISTLKDNSDSQTFSDICIHEICALDMLIARIYSESELRTVKRCQLGKDNGL